MQPLPSTKPSVPAATPPLSSAGINSGSNFIGLSAFTGNLIALSLAGAPLTSPDEPVVLKIIVLLVLPLLAARLQVKTWQKNLENQSHLL